MAQTTPPTINAAPAAPQRGNKATFPGAVDAFLTWLVTAVTQFGAVATNVYNNAVDAFNSATSAANSAATATTQANAAVSGVNAIAWVSGTTYAAGDCRYSPIDFRTYRRKTNGAGTTDPSADPTNWMVVSNVPYALTLLATISPVAAANVDFLNVFNSTYDDYLIIIDGVRPGAEDAMFFRAASGGVVDTNTRYGSGVSNITATSAHINLSSSVTTTGAGLNARITVQNVNSTAAMKCMEIVSFSQGPNANPYQLSQFLAVYTGPTPMTGFRLYWGILGSLFQAQGSVRVYGIQKS